MPPKGPNTDSYLSKMLESCNLKGNIAECGVYKGYNTYYYCDLLKSFPDKTLHAFDSFSGFPDNNDNVENKFCDTSFDLVANLLSNFNNVQLHKGLFKDTLNSVDSEIFCCVILDCDLYESYKDCLLFFSDKMVSGGVIILDEYYSLKYPLAKTACDEFVKSNKKFKLECFHIEDNGWQRWCLVAE